MTDGQPAPEWRMDNSLDAQLGAALADWIGRAVGFNTNVIPTPPGWKQPVMILEIHTAPQFPEEDESPVRLRCLFSLDNAEEFAKTILRDVAEGREVYQTMDESDG